MKRQVVLALFLVAPICGVGCGSEPGPGPDETGPSTVTTPAPENETPSDATPENTPGIPSGSAGGTSSDPTATGFPCDVRAILQTYCAGCHTGQLYVPHFYTRADFVAPWGAVDSWGARAATQVAERKMPPYGAPRPSANDSQIIIAWVGAGMPAGTCGALTAPR